MIKQVKFVSIPVHDQDRACHVACPVAEQEGHHLGYLLGFSQSSQGRFGQRPPASGPPTWQGESRAEWEMARGRGGEGAGRAGSLKVVTTRADGVLARADERVFGGGGVMDEAQKAVVQLNAMLTDARESLKKADAILVNAQNVTADVKTTTGNINAATTDLAALRTEVDDSIRKVNALIDEINRKWPFARKTEVKLP